MSYTVIRDTNTLEIRASIATMSELREFITTLEDRFSETRKAEALPEGQGQNTITTVVGNAVTTTPLTKGEMK